MSEEPQTVAESAFAAALVAAIADMPPIGKDQTATVPTKSGGSYQYSYADLASILAVITPILAKHGLAISQEARATIVDGGTFAGCKTTVWHSSGNSIEASLLLPVPGRPRRDGPDLPPGPQDVGSAITYARRYSLSIVGVVTEEDDDGARAMPNPSDNYSNPRSMASPSDAQIRRYQAKLSNACNGDRDLQVEAATQIKRWLGIDSVKNATREQYDRACELADNWPDSMMGGSETNGGI